MKHQCTFFILGEKLKASMGLLRQKNPYGGLPVKVGEEQNGKMRVGTNVMGITEKAILAHKL